MVNSRFAFCMVAISPLRKEASDAAEQVSQLLFGELVEIVQKKHPWIEVLTLSDHYSGWIDEKHVLPLTEKEVKRWMDGRTVQREFIRPLQTPWGKQWITSGAFVPDSNELEFYIGNLPFEWLNLQHASPNSILDFAKQFLNSPYLWGGKSPFGIDCSGFTQVVFRAFDLNLPRDAYQQAEVGLEIPFEDRLAGDLVFFKNAADKIHHVGILISPNEIIHASGRVRIDSFNATGIYNHEKEQITHQLFNIKRV